MSFIWAFMLNNELHTTTLKFDGKLEKTEAKTTKLDKDLEAMSLTNTKLGSKNEALYSKVEKITASEASMKVKLSVAIEDMKTAESRVLASEEAQRLAEMRAMVVENSIALINCDYDAIVVEKNSWLAEANSQLARVNEELVDVRSQHAEVEARAVRAYKMNFPQTPEYALFIFHFMEAGDNQLIKRINATHLEWVLSFLFAEAPLPTVTSASIQSIPSEVLTLGSTLGTPSYANPTEVLE
ncbi:hypothetical protein Adt_14231 [Abeliophyllum distichum]|uniref:GRIP domain-containing protein n=1 Tax=Abeliophyllum distichum TaxID=126358 RepID=A0ABD1TZ34_9LAMI